MRIAAIEVLTLANPRVDAAACDSAQDDVLVRITTDTGLVGIAEVDAPPGMIRAVIEAPGSHNYSFGLRELLLGEDPCDVERLWDRMYEATWMAGRRGLVINAIGALDLAFWDIRGQALGQPVHALLGGHIRPHVAAYASLLMRGTTPAEVFGDLQRKVSAAAIAGFRAVKLEVVVPTFPDDDSVVEAARLTRELLGPKRDLLLDVGYRWRDAKTALAVARRLEPYDPYFLETPLPPDDLQGHARLARWSPIRIAAGEFQTTRFEFEDLMDRAKLDVVQPDVARAGGLTECVRIARMARDRGVLVVPHAWKTGLTVAAAVHLSAVCDNCPYVEYLPPDLHTSELTRELVREGPQPEGGLIPLPVRAGLGCVLDETAVRKYNSDPASGVPGVLA